LSFGQPRLAIKQGRSAGNRRKDELHKLVLAHIDYKSKIHTPSSDRSKVTSRSTIGSAAISTLLSAAVIVESSTKPTVGRCYVAVFIEDRDENIKATLCKGYVYDMHPVDGNGALVIRESDKLRIESLGSLAGVTIRVRGMLIRNVSQPGGWTGLMQGSTEGPGFQRTIIGDNPAVGANSQVDSIPTNARHRIISIRRSVITDGNAGNRLVRLEYTVDGAVAGFINSAETFTTPDNKIITFYNGMSTSPKTGEDEIAGFIPADLILEPGDQLRTLVDGLRIGDDMGSATIFVEEWLVP